MWPALCMGRDKSMSNVETNKPLVRVEHLKKYFVIPRKGKLHAVDDVSFEIQAGETLGLVGESGCGKSTVGNVVMQLLDKTDGKIFINDREPAASGPERNEFCRNVQMIFQDPYSSLNSRKTIKDILSEPLLVQKLYKKGPELDARLKELCETVGLSTDLLNHYPHELDGGMRQVVGIARALSLNPGFIICDEPVSALDVSVQAKIINLLMDLQEKKHLSYLFISHDLSVVKHISTRIAVMYLGQIVEMADKEEMFANTMHPYSIALLSAVPRVSVDRKVSRIVLKGDVPSPMNPKPGCRFAPRCWMARPECFENDQPLHQVSPGHWVACQYASESRSLMKDAETSSLEEMLNTDEEKKGNSNEQ